MGPAIAGLTGPIGEALGDQPPFGIQFSALVAGGLNALNFVLAYFMLPETLKKDEKRERLSRRPGDLLSPDQCAPGPRPQGLVRAGRDLASTLLSGRSRGLGSPRGPARSRGSIAHARRESRLDLWKGSTCLRNLPFKCL